MGWGIKIPELNIDTGEFIGGDVGKGISTISDTFKKNPTLGMLNPTLLAGIGATKALNPFGLWSEPGAEVPAQNFGDLTSKWDRIAGGFTSQGMPQAINAAQTNTNMGKQNALATLGQFGGQGVGAQGRLERQGKMSMFGNAQEAANQANISKTQSQMQGILGLDLPIQMGKDMAAAQANALRTQNNASTWGLIGSLAGAGLGSLAGPAGIAAGASVGGGLGTNLGRRM